MGMVIVFRTGCGGRASQSRPEMAVGEGVSGTRFEITLKALGLFQCFKGNVEFESPRF
jgi:hypothetical protein